MLRLSFHLFFLIFCLLQRWVWVLDDERSHLMDAQFLIPQWLVTPTQEASKPVTLMLSHVLRILITRCITSLSDADAIWVPFLEHNFLILVVDVAEMERVVKEPCGK